MAHASDAFLRAAATPPGTLPGEVAGAVRLSASEMVGMEVLPPMLARLRARHPGLVVELDLSNASANLAEQEADVAVRMHPPRQDTLVARRVGEVPLGLFAHVDYLATRGAPTSTDDLAGHDVIGPERGSPDWRVVEALLPPAARDRIVVRTSSHPAQLACARAGLGIAVVQRPVGLADPRLAPVLPGFELAALPLWLVTHRSLRALPRVRATLDHLAQEIARYAKA
jgi:DNA-binding transcriptional LysR family regulator